MNVTYKHCERHVGFAYCPHCARKLNSHCMVHPSTTTKMRKGDAP